MANIKTLTRANTRIGLKKQKSVGKKYLIMDKLPHKPIKCIAFSSLVGNGMQINTVVIWKR